MAIRPPKKKTPKVTALSLARSRKITGRLNKDDVDNARFALKNATPAEMKRYAGEVARMQARKTGQTKGPAGRKR